MLVVFYVVAFNDPVGARNAIVSLPIGKIRGSSMRSSSGREFLAFRGIPYAKPPIAERRFQVSIRSVLCEASELRRK